MSYWVTLEIDTGGTEPAPVGEDWNYTSNCAKTWRKAGADLAEFDGKRAGDVAPILRGAIDAMKTDPDTYRAMDPPNGWGSYDTLVPALERLLGNLEAHPLAVVRISR